MYNFSELDRIIRERRSIFPNDFTGERVDDSLIRQMLENANWAPTHKLTEPWRFVVFTGEGLKALANFQGEVYKSVTMADGTFREDKHRNLMLKPLECSHIIAVGMKRDHKKGVPEWEELGAVFCAVQNMYLTATAYGIACYLSTGGITNFKQAKGFFGLDEEDKLCGFMYIGVPKPDLKFGMKRKPVSEKIKWVN